MGARQLTCTVRQLASSPGAPAAWITEDVVPVPRNIYGLTKGAAENLCELFHGIRGLPCLILRTSRFFPEPDDREETRRSYDDVNVKMNEFLYRRADIEDVVAAHLLALEKAHALGFGRYIVSATTPFTRDDARELRTNAARVVSRRVPRYEDVYARHGWSMFPGIDRVYINERAKEGTRLDTEIRLCSRYRPCQRRRRSAQSIGARGRVKRVPRCCVCRWTLPARLTALAHMSSRGVGRTRGMVVRNQIGVFRGWRPSIARTTRPSRMLESAERAKALCTS